MLLSVAIWFANLSEQSTGLDVRVCVRQSFGIPRVAKFPLQNIFPAEIEATWTAGV